MANLDLAFASLFWDLINRKTGDLGRVECKPQKPPFDLTGDIEQPFPRSTPEEQGVDSAYLASFIADLRQEPAVAAHALMILRHGHVIYEGGFDPYSRKVWHVTYSMCKSFTGMAIGLLIDDGRLHLEDSVTDILLPHDLMNPMRVLARTRYAGLTIRHLLTMQSGSSFNEIGAISGNNWIKGFFDASTKFAPGVRFDYNSMNSYILSAIVTSITGKTMFEFLQERLFEPMGIRKVFWETSPEGITKGGWGMFILQEDAAKLAQLYLQQGMWNGRQLISSDWVRESTSPQVETRQQANPQYGYHIWMCDMPGSYMFNGMLGQNVYVYPAHDMIIVINAGNSEVFAGGSMTQLIRRYWGADFFPSKTPLSASRASLKMLRNVKNMAEQTGISQKQCRPAGLQGRIRQICRDYITKRTYRWICTLDGCTYRMQPQNVGLFPLMMQVVHNNYTKGIRKLRFRYSDETLHIDFLEGTVWNSIPVGFQKGRHTAITIGGEEYLVGCRGKVSLNEDDEPVLSLRIAFIEEATERLLKIVFHSGQELELHWSESPSNAIIGETLAGITTGSGNVNKVAEKVLEQINPELIESAIKYTIHPRVLARLEEDTGVQHVQAAEETRQNGAGRHLDESESK